MRNLLYEPFLEATRNVFSLMLDLNDIVCSPVSELNARPCELNVSIDVMGDLTGSVIYRFPGETSLKMVGILSGMEFSAVDDFVASAMGEVANIISGNVMTVLSNRKLNCDILPPKVVEDAAYDAGNYDIRHAECLTTDAGDIELSILLNKAV